MPFSETLGIGSGFAVIQQEGDMFTWKLYSSEWTLQRSGSAATQWGAEQAAGNVGFERPTVITQPDVIPITQPTEQINTTGPDWEAINRGIAYNQYLEDLFGPWGLNGPPPPPEAGPHYVGPDIGGGSESRSPFPIEGSAIGAAGALLLILALGAGALR